MNREMVFLPQHRQMERLRGRGPLSDFFKLDFLLAEGKKEQRKDNSFSIFQLCLITKQTKSKASPS